MRQTHKIVDTIIETLRSNPGLSLRELVDRLENRVQIFVKGKLDKEISKAALVQGLFHLKKSKTVIQIEDKLYLKEN